MCHENKRNTSTKQFFARNSGQLIRLGRKKHGISRNTLAHLLCVPESHAAKMEQGVYQLSAEQWFSICQLLKIPYDAIKTGFLDRTQVVQKISHQKNVGEFKIPERYANLQGSGVRSMLPLLSFVKKVLGEEHFLHYLRFKQMDPDYFFDFSHQLNINFSLDIFRDMIRTNKLTPSTLLDVTNVVKDPAIHGALGEDYLSAKTVPMILERVVRHIKKYEVNCSYEITDYSKRTLDLSITPGDYLKAFSYHDSCLNNVMCLYKKNYIKQLATFQGLPGATVTELTCHFERSSDNCIYRIAV